MAQCGIEVRYRDKRYRMVLRPKEGGAGAAMRETAKAAIGSTIAILAPCGYCCITSSPPRISTFLSSRRKLMPRSAEDSAPRGATSAGTS